MIERLIRMVLRDGLDTLPLAQLRAYLTMQGLPEDEVAKVASYFSSVKFDVIHNYPREGSGFPLFAIILGNEDEEVRFLRDDVGRLPPQAAAALRESKLSDLFQGASIERRTYHVWCCTDQPDTTIYAYNVAKLIMKRARPFFHDQSGLGDLNFSGSDIVPDDRYAPHYIFVRRLTMTCLAQDTVIYDPEPVVRSVTGIHIDDGTDLGVQANVTPYVAGEESDDDTDG